MMICLPPQGTPPPTQQPTRPTVHTAHSLHCGHTALPQGRSQIPADAPTPLNLCMLAPFRRLRPRVGAKAHEYWFIRLTLNAPIPLLCL